MFQSLQPLFDGVLVGAEHLGDVAEGHPVDIEEQELPLGRRQPVDELVEPLDLLVASGVGKVGEERRVEEHQGGLFAPVTALAHGGVQRHTVDPGVQAALATEVEVAAPERADDVLIEVDEAVVPPLGKEQTDPHDGALHAAEHRLKLAFMFTVGHRIRRVAFQKPAYIISRKKGQKVSPC